MHTLLAKHVIYDSKPTSPPLGVEVYLSPEQWQSYETSEDRATEITYLMVDGSSHHQTFSDVGQVDLIQPEGADPYYKLTFWFEL